MQKVLLKEIASITSGFTFRSAVGNNPKGNLNVIQAKDVSSGMYIKDEDLNRTSLEKFKTSALVKKGDVILTARGKFRAAVATVKVEAIASSSVYIIHTSTPQVLPEYLAIYLNSPPVQIGLIQYSSGNYIKSILKPNLENTPVLLPPINQQNRMVRLYNNIEQQKKILNQKINILTNISEKSFTNLINIH